MRRLGVRLTMVFALAFWMAIAFGLLLPIANAQAPTANADPVAALKELLKVVERDGTPARVTDFRVPGHWCKRHYTATKIKYDVEKNGLACLALRSHCVMV